MDTNNFYKDKKVMVCGAARSGVGAAILLSKNGSHVTLQDNKITEPPKELLDLNINFHLGKDVTDINFDVIIISPGIRYDTPFLVKAREAGVYVIGEFELGTQFYKGDIYAITGTNGKTTTTMLVSHIFNQKENTNTVGNIGIPITSVNYTNRTCVAEVSSFQLETVDKFAPKVSAVINLTPDHLDRHFTMANYKDIKARIFENQTQDDYLILNFDNKYTKSMSQLAKSKVVFFSMRVDSVENNDNFFIYNKETCMILGKLDNKNISVNISEYKLVGLHNVENAIVSVIMSIVNGIDIDTIEKAIKSFSPPEHRLEYVKQVNDTIFFNDSKATNPESSIKSIESVSGKPIVLIAGGVLKDVDYTDWANLIHDKVSHTVVIGSNENQQKMLDVLGTDNLSTSSSLQNAVQQAYTKAKGGIVLFSPATASFDMFKDYEERGRQFKEIVKNLKWQ